MANLTRYVRESRSKKALPVLITPVARRKFDSAGRIQGTHDRYSELVRQVAAQEKDIAGFEVADIVADKGPAFPFGKKDQLVLDMLVPRHFKLWRAVGAGHKVRVLR